MASILSRSELDVVTKVLLLGDKKTVLSKALLCSVGGANYPGPMSW